MNKLKSILTSGISKKAVFAIIVLAAVDMLSMTAPYYLKYVIPNLNTYLNVTQPEFDSVTAVLGWVVLACQIPSGWLADKLSGKKLLIISVVMSGIFTVFFGMATQSIFGSAALPMLYITFAGFGVSTTLFLWSPLWKVLSAQGNSKEQSKIYGLQGSYNGLMGLILVTLIGTIATSLAKGGDNILFYIMVYIIAGGLFISAWATHKFVKDTNEKSSLLKMFKGWFGKAKDGSETIWQLIKSLVKPLKSLRVWLLAFSVLGMYMFQSIFAYYLKDYMVMVVPAVAITALAGFRTYGLRLLVSAPFGDWINKRSSWILTLSIILFSGIMVATLAVLIAGIGDNITAKTSGGYIKFLAIMLPILFIIIGTLSWFLVAGRYIQINEIPSTKHNYGTIIAIISFISFSSDAWFYQMASSWMKSSGHVMDDADVLKLGYGTAGNYDQAGLQKLLFVALGIGAFGAICGFTAFILNKQELKKLNKTNYRWRIEENHG